MGKVAGVGAKNKLKQSISHFCYARFCVDGFTGGG